MAKIRFVLNPETDAVPGFMIDPQNPNVFYSTATLGSTTFKVARFINGTLDAAFTSELPPGNYFFSESHVDETLPSFRVDGPSGDLVIAVTVDGVGPVDVIRMSSDGSGYTLNPWPNTDMQQDVNRIPIVKNFQTPPVE